MATQTPSSELGASLNSASEPSGVGSGPGSDEELSLLELVAVIAEQKGVALWTTGLFAIVSLIVSSLLPKWFTANVTTLPPQQNSSLSAAMASQLGSFSAGAFGWWEPWSKESERHVCGNAQEQDC